MPLESTDDHDEPDVVSDVELITAARLGDRDAFGELYRRHVDAARRLASRLARRRADVDDLVSDAFARVSGALARGRGPDIAFRPYLYTTLRRVAYDRTAAGRREHVVDDTAFEAFDDATEPLVDPAVADLERSLTARAYRSLPERWQAVLWYTEVEEMGPADVGALLGLSANATAALAYRAREGLRQAYLQAHVATEPLRSCRPTIDRLGGYVRGGLSERERNTVESHLDDCERCRALYLELADVNHGMRAFVAPLFLGAGATQMLVKGGVVAWLWRLRPRTPAATAAAATVAAVAVVAGALAVTALVGDDGPTQPATGADRSAPTASGPANSVPGITTDTTTTDAPVTATTGPPGSSSTGPSSSTPTTIGGSGPTGSTPGTTNPAVTNAATTAAPTSTVAPVPADLQVTISDVGALVAGRAGIVSVVVANAGGTTATAVAIEIESSVGIEFEATTPAKLSTARNIECRRGSTLRCSLGAIGPGTDVVAVLRASPTTPGPAEISVRVSAAADDGNPADNAMTLTTQVHETGLAARWSGVGRLAVRTAANSVLSCDTDLEGCAAARDRVGNALRNNDWRMVAVDIDNDPATINSSAADLVLAGRVAFAGLYWGGDAGDAAAGLPLDRVLLTAGGTRTAVVASRTDRMGSRYQSFADVTTQLRFAGSGQVTVANVAAREGLDQFGGWSLIVVLDDSSFPQRTVSVFDGLLNVAAGTTARATIGGFVARPGAAVTIGLVAYDGDAGATGDAVRLDGFELHDGQNPADDVMNSTVSDRGALSGGRDPAALNTFGLDVDLIDVSGRLAEGATSAVLDFVTGAETYLVGAAVAQVDRV